MDFKELCAKEPGLAELEADILSFRASKRRLGACVLMDWYRRFKPRLMGLVGFECSKPELMGCDCYDVAYEHLCGLLTDRKHKPAACIGDEIITVIGNGRPGHYRPFDTKTGRAME